MSSTQAHSQTHIDSSIDLEPPPPSFSSLSPTTGDETLPPYTNHLQLASLCRRKREFQAAFDKTSRGRRTWELVWLVLDGTALRVYRPMSQEKRAVEGTDLGGLVRTGSRLAGSTTRSTSMLNIPLPPPSASAGAAARLSLARVLEGRRGHPTAASGATGSPSDPLMPTSEPRMQLTRSRDAQGLVDSSVPSSSRGRHRRMDSIAKVALSAPPAYPSPSHSVTTAPYPYSASTPFLTDPPTLTSGFPHSATTAVTLPDFSKRKACRQYHLQHAICMRADAYTKREHVLRFVLADGKQFIVQLSSRVEIISWLQLMSIAAPLSLDLDERPMPEPAHYPRRRPRARTPHRPSTAPGALERSTSSPTTTTTTQSAQGSRSAMGSNAAIPSVPHNVVDSTIVGGGGEGEGEGEDDDDDGDNDSDGDPLIVEEDMDHLPPPRRPVLPRSLSSVEQARRRGIQL